MKKKPNIIWCTLIIKNDQLIVWDYMLHNQFEITEDHLIEMRRVSARQPPLNSKIFSELLENGIVTD
ncbi:MAG: hypothetical protein A3F13_09685 [Gammaproteobacteria bacterium RIFCSPHIGHO2_12_FULL_40_19]|nr:MAG: hypothetical protein A3F13_09685 [Gammaproteobacteria bacterium RIFCSPHIGHO2_12_FULL_40_19]